MITQNLTGYVTNKIINESHPIIDSSRCINCRQKKISCKICEASCHVDALKDIKKPNFNACDDCGICSAACPSGAIVSSFISTQRMLNLLDDYRQNLTLGCNYCDDTTSLSMPCLAAYNFEFLAVLILRGTNISFRKGNCAACDLQPQMMLFTRTLGNLQDFLGNKLYSKALSSQIISNEIMDRRQAMRDMFKKSGRNVISLLPDKLKDNIDGDFFKKLLLSQVLLIREDNEDSVKVNWTSPVFNNKCTACQICTRLCPNVALRTIKDKNNNFYMLHFSWLCRGCGVCRAVCVYGGIEGFADITLSKPDKPYIYKTGAHPCAKCGEPCAENEELCMECKIKGY